MTSSDGPPWLLAHVKFRFSILIKLGAASKFLRRLLRASEDFIVLDVQDFVPTSWRCFLTHLQSCWNFNFIIVARELRTVVIVLFLHSVKLWRRRLRALFAWDGHSTLVSINFRCTLHLMLVSAIVFLDEFPLLFFFKIFALFLQLSFDFSFITWQNF